MLQKLAATEPSSARIFKAIADPPTTSLQRLKGLTTGGLPTFIDVGNSFGAPAIIEDNLIYQLVKNRKRVLMMGDDTWLQLFPDHFEKSYPYPSFNVKDLDTVDNGVIEHLLPSLYKEDWDVLIAHFLGVDHAGHIYGVDSVPMIQKLEQYNDILEKVIEALKSQSGFGGLHENTFLIVMGDHGQTTNGDHGGGTAEEVETSLFAMSLRNPPDSVSSVLDTSFCNPDLDAEMVCCSSFPQLDFSVTMAALLGIPFPFGSIGRINPELYALSAGTWDPSLPTLDEWMRSYINALCINCWQVKRYIDRYSATSVIGFPSEDMHRVSELYTQAQANLSNMLNKTLFPENDTPGEIRENFTTLFQTQIDVYSNFLESFAKIARSAWTEFDLLLMGVGLSVMLVSLCIQFFTIKRVNHQCQSYYPSPDTTFRMIQAFFLVTIRGASFLSNSYILEEGRVANFLLATSGILNLSFSVSKRSFAIDEFVFLLLNIILRYGIEFGKSKQSGLEYLYTHLLSMLGISMISNVWIVLLEILPIVLLFFLSFLLFRCTTGISCWRILRYFIVMGTIFSYTLIAMHWTSESKLVAVSATVQNFGRNFVPRLVYALGFGLLIMLALTKTFDLKERALKSPEWLFIATMCMLSSWSSSVLILLGTQGPLVALICITGAWCILKLSRVEWINPINTTRTLGALVDPVSVAQWSLLAVSLFFYTGHWCTFDGLRYGAAFIGFDDFNIIRQGILLAIDTFGVSHILPILSLPLFVIFHRYEVSEKNLAKGINLLHLTQVFLIYGFITTLTTTFTIICVTVQRRHLMVWGLFTPKYVFDVLGLILTDVLICMASLYYY